MSTRIPSGERPVVFVGPYEHHSKELPWRESFADVVVIDADVDGHIDVAALEGELVRVVLIARHCHRLLPDYRFDATTGLW